MGRKAERIILENITTALENIGFVKFVHLFEAAVDDTDALEDGLHEISAKRLKQFDKGISLLIKARRGAERDDECEDDDECDCCTDTSWCSNDSEAKKGKKKKAKKQKMVDMLQGCRRITRMNVGNLLSQMTGLHIWLLGKKNEIIPFYPDVVDRIMRESDTVNELHCALASLFDCGLEMSFDETIIDGATPLLHSNTYPATIREVISQ